MMQITTSLHSEQRGPMGEPGPIGCAMLFSSMLEYTVGAQVYWDT